MTLYVGTDKSIYSDSPVCQNFRSPEITDPDHPHLQCRDWLMSDSLTNDQEPTTTVHEANPPPPVTDSPSRSIWLLALLVSAALAVAAMNYAPQPYIIPERLANLGLNTPPEVQRESEEVLLQVLWRNSLIAFGLAGACLALPSVLMVHWQKTGWAVLAVIGSIAAGAVCGMLAVVLAFALREQFSPGGWLASLAADDQAMLPDLILWVVMSVFLAFPVALALLVAGESLFSQKVTAVPLAGLLTGLLMPIGVSLLLPAAKTSDVPPQGLLVTGGWMAVLAIFLFLLTTFTGSKRSKLSEESVTAENPA